jgi:hypothetical protein
MKFYVELDGDRQSIVEADSPIEAIAMLWERRADTCRDISDVQPDYWIHCGISHLGGNVESWAAFWMLSPTAMFTIRHVLKSQVCDEATYQHACQILLNHHPENELDQ